MGSNIMQAWLVENVVPNVVAWYLVQFAVTIAPNCLACFDDECTIPILPALKSRVQQAYKCIQDPNKLPGTKIQWESTVLS